MEKYSVDDIKIVDDINDMYLKTLYIDDIYIGNIKLLDRNVIYRPSGKSIKKIVTDTIGYLDLLCSKRYIGSIGRSDTYIEKVNDKSHNHDFIRDFLKPITYLDKGTLVGKHLLDDKFTFYIEKNGSVLVEINGILFYTDLFKIYSCISQMKINQYSIVSETTEFKYEFDDEYHILKVTDSEENQDAFSPDNIFIDDLEVVSGDNFSEVFRDNSENNIVILNRDLTLTQSIQRAKYLYRVAIKVSSLKDKCFYNLGFGSIMKYNLDGSILIAIINDNHQCTVFKFNNLEDYSSLSSLGYDDLLKCKYTLIQYGVISYTQYVEEFLEI